MQKKNNVMCDVLSILSFNYIASLSCSSSEEDLKRKLSEMEEWIGGKGIEGKCRENESHEMWSWSPESSWFQKVPLWGVW